VAISAWPAMAKLNLTRQKHTFNSQKKCTTTQNKHKLASYRPTTSSLENGQGLFWFRRFINSSLTYLLTHLQPQDPHGAYSLKKLGTPHYEKSIHIAAISCIHRKRRKVEENGVTIIRIQQTSTLVNRVHPASSGQSLWT